MSMWTTVEYIKIDFTNCRCQVRWHDQAAHLRGTEIKVIYKWTDCIYLLFSNFTFENGQNQQVPLLCAKNFMYIIPFDSKQPHEFQVIVVPILHIWKLMLREVKRQTTESCRSQ